MRSLGMPYIGSKTRYARRIIKALPSADTFVDLFAGGGAITHAAILSNKYKNFVSIVNFNNRSILGSSGSKKKPSEHIFIRRDFVDWYNDLMRGD